MRRWPNGKAAVPKTADTHVSRGFAGANPALRTNPLFFYYPADPIGMDTIQNATANLYIPYKKAILPLKASDPEQIDGDPQPQKNLYRAAFLSPGVWNGTTFRPEVLEEMVSYHSANGSAEKLRICAEHEDTVLSLIGRSHSLTMEDLDGAPDAVVGEFELFNQLQLQKDVITQIQQAPDLIGLSVCASGDIVPTIDAGTGEITEWVWTKLRLEHIAIVTWPACDTTAGSIVAAYKHADGTEFNPAIFTHRPTEYAMADPTISQTPTPPEIGAVTQTTGTAMYGTNSQAGAPSPIAKDETKYAAALDLAQVISLSKTLGIEPNPVLLASLTAEQAKDYAAELSKIAEARQAPSAAPVEKGSAYGAPTDDTLSLARQLLNYGGNAA